jgi:hypothetical protein
MNKSANQKLTKIAKPSPITSEGRYSVQVRTIQQRNEIIKSAILFILSSQEGIKYSSIVLGG